MTRYWGRAPVLFWTTLIGFLFSVGSACATTFPTFYAMRALTGWFLTAPQTISIAFLKDCFFFHERASKIGLWSTLYIASPYIGPCFANFLVSGVPVWQDVFWLNSGVAGLQLCFIVAFIDETWFNRDLPTSDHPPRSQNFLSRMSRLTGIWQLRNHRHYFDGIWPSYRCFLAVLGKPALVLILLN
jgi:MFS family permease